MALRKGHGAGKGTPRVEILPADEQPPATPAITVRVERNPNGTFAAGNTVSRAKRLRPGRAGNLSLNRTDPEYRPFAAWGRRYASHRRQELAKAHGGVISAGVGAMVESEALAMAASRFLYSKGAETGDQKLLTSAAALADKSKQAAHAAWELASREATVHGDPYLAAVEAEQREFQRALAAGEFDQKDESE